MALWSFAAQWRFPDALPHGVDARQLDAAARRTRRTGVDDARRSARWRRRIALRAGARRASRTRAGGTRARRARALWLLYVPLLVPQVAFLFGAQVLLVRLELRRQLLAAVVWAHLVFVLPYLFLSLADPWRALDPRYARTAAALGASPARMFCGVKLPLLLRPMLDRVRGRRSRSASGQYLPTLFAGNGRVATLTTEAVTLASGARPARDRRVRAAAGAASAASSIWLRRSLPALLFAQRRGRGDASAMRASVRGPLRLEAVRIALGRECLIAALDVDVAPGECVTVMGPSGCGKSTLLAFISGTLDPAFAASGRVARSAAPTSRALAPERGAWASCSRTTCCSRICRWAAISRSRCDPRCAIARRAARASRRRWPRPNCRASPTAIRPRCPAASARASR